MLQVEEFQHQNKTCYRKELEGCPVEITEQSYQATLSKSEKLTLSEPDTGSKSEEAVCSDLYYKRLEKSLSKNFDEDNASTKPQKFVDVDSEC